MENKKIDTLENRIDKIYEDCRGKKVEHARMHELWSKYNNIIFGILVLDFIALSLSVIATSATNNLYVSFLSYPFIIILCVVYPFEKFLSGKARKHKAFETNYHWLREDIDTKRVTLDSVDDKKYYLTYISNMLNSYTKEEPSIFGKVKKRWFKQVMEEQENETKHTSIPIPQKNEEDDEEEIPAKNAVAPVEEVKLSVN